MTDAELAIVVKLKDAFSRQLDSIVKNTDKGAKQMESSWKKLTTGIFAAKAAVAGWLTGQVARGIGSMAEFSATVDRANVAFGAMARRIGMDATDAIKAMREASGGAVGDLDLMAAANRAIMLGAVDSAASLERLTYYGARLGNAMGLTAAEGINYFTTGLARQSTAILDNVGIIIDLEEEYARLGKKQEDLTADEQRSLFSDAVWRKAGEAIKALGDRLPETAMAVDKLAASWMNLKKAMADFAQPAISGFFKWMEEGIRNWTEGKYGITALDIMKIKLEEILKLRTQISESERKEINRVLGGGWDNWNEDPNAPIEQQKIRIQQAASARKTYEKMNWDRWVSESDFDVEMMRRETNRNKFYNVIAAGNKRAQETAHPTPEYPYRQPTQEDATYVNEVWEAMKKGAKDYYRTVESAMAQISTCVYRVFQDIEANLGEVFFDAMQGKMKSFKEYLASFVKDISRTLSQMMARQALGGLLGLILPGTSLIPVGGIQTPLTTTVYPAHQYGGITSEPSIAGEAGPEAVVPLPFNRHIPVDIRGAQPEQNVAVTFNISAVDGPSVQRMLASQGRTITQIIQDAMGRDQQFRAAVQAV